MTTLAAQDIAYPICMAVSAAILLFSLGIAVFLPKLHGTNGKKRILTPWLIVSAGVFLSATVLLIPYYQFTATPDMYHPRNVIHTMLLSLYHAARLFIIEGDLPEIIRTRYNDLYGVLFALICGIALATTIRTVVAFFQKSTVYGPLKSRKEAPAYVFSELNEKSLTLAADIKKNHADALLVFCDVFEQNDETSFETVERAKRLGAFCFKDDMLALRPHFTCRSGALYFFAIADERLEGAKHDKRLSPLTVVSGEEENIRQAYTLATDPHFLERKNTHLYVFSQTTLGELLLSNLPNGKIKVRRVNDIRSLIYHSLSKPEVMKSLFDSVWTDKNGKKHIHAVIVGLGGHGGVMLRTLLWFCQIEGYELTIDAFDGDDGKRENFCTRFPEIMKCNGCNSENDARYTLNFRTGYSVKSPTFWDAVQGIDRPTFLLVSLGSDALNIDTAVALRRYFRRRSQTPEIYAIVYDSYCAKVLPKATNYKGDTYGIKCIGSLAETYSEDAILNDALEDKAKRIHTESYKGSEASFFQYEYNYRSSMASALYHSLLCERKIIDPKKREDEYEDAELEPLRKQEQIRWNAYMRSEGYRYAPTRDDVALTHNLLISYDRLSPEQKGNIKVPLPVTK